MIKKIREMIRIEPELQVPITIATVCTFVFTYFYNLVLSESAQYMAIAILVLADGAAGILAGIKREGFKTFKALKILVTLVVWWSLQTVLISIEDGFKGTSWMSETILIPLVFFEVISILKNLASANLIKDGVLVEILKNIDRHKNLENKKD